jgi:DNA-binding NarL/FixJ family response regulator
VDPTNVRVLIVDDSEDLRFLMRMTLDRQAGFTVVAEAADGAQGVAAAAAHQPDVVLLDISMPVMDGLQALPLIRAECPAAKVVMLSAFEATSAAALQSLRMGAHGYIEKTGATARLTRQLRDIVGRAASGSASVSRT